MLVLEERYLSLLALLEKEINLVQHLNVDVVDALGSHSGVCTLNSHEECDGSNPYCTYGHSTSCKGPE